VEAKKVKIKLEDPADVRLSNIVDMGLTFSAMIRLYEKGSKKKLHKEILHILPDIANQTSYEQFQNIHNKFCLWGIKNLSLAEKKRYGRMIKNGSSPSYGQIAKTLDVVLKVAIYYSKWPNEPVSERIGKYIHAAVDTKMMAFLKSKYPDHFEIWPVTVGSVNRPRYLSIQELVRQFIADQHSGQIMPVQFDDLYWKFLNRPTGGELKKIPLRITK
jgi:hypothetical protein